MALDNQPSKRIRFLESLGADPATIEELLAYNDRAFDHASMGTEAHLRLPPELHIAAWRVYGVEAEQIGGFAALRKRLVQLRFPVQAGISQSGAYRAATRRGIFTDEMPEASGLQLTHPEKLQLRIHESLAGPIPVLIARGRADFVALLQTLIHRNEPAPIPDSMGAMMVAGFNNWDRVGALKARWCEEHPDDVIGQGWAREFQDNVVPNKELYQDSFILLSDGSYSGVAAADLGLAEDEWRQLSVAIRLEHECTHFFTRRVFRSMQNHALDELLADYRGIVAATGRFRADWFLRFMGLENFPEYRSTGRLGHYRGDPPLSDKAFGVIQSLVKRAADNVERFDHEHAELLKTREAQLRMLLALCRMTLDQLAADACSVRLSSALN
jgi:hypothetical protein